MGSVYIAARPAAAHAAICTERHGVLATPKPSALVSGCDENTARHSPSVRFVSDSRYPCRAIPTVTCPMPDHESSQVRSA